MKKIKVVKVDGDEITFENGVKLSSYHSQDCCEEHSLSLGDLTMADFEGLEFDLTTEDFFKRIPQFGIELIPILGHSVKIPGHGYNNGYYSDQLDLVLTDENGVETRFDISECQTISD